MRRILGLLVTLIPLFLRVSDLSAQAPVPDDFNSTTLNTSVWTFVNPVGNGSYFLNGGELRLSVPAGSVHDVWTTGDNAARVMQTISNNDFEILAKFNSPVTAGDQMQGIIVEQNSSNFLRFDFRHDGASPRLFAASIAGATGTFRIDTPLSKSIAPPLWLKVKRAGNAWTESWSTDGVNYTVGGTFQFTLNANKVGIFAGNYRSPASSAPAMTAAVDYFYNMASVPVGPDMTITKTHTGNFTQGGTGTYTITAKNSGTGPTSGTITVTDMLPTGLTATAFNGTGWTCALTPTVNCTRNDVIAAGGSFPALTLTVSVATNAPSSVANTATVAGGGETNTSNDTTSDATTILVPGLPDMTITKTHAGNFTQGGMATYTITAKNSGTGPTSGTITVTDMLPTGLIATAFNGTGWTCALTPTANCTRNDMMAAGGSYPALTLTVSVATNAPGSVANIATVAGGGETNTSNDTTSDTTIVTSPAGPPASDDFNTTTLNTPPWTFVNPVGNGIYSLNGGELRLSVPAGSVHDVWTTGDNAARVMQTISNADFEILAKFNSPVTAGDQMQGIIVEQNSSNFLRFDFRHDGASPRLFAASIAGATGTFRIDIPLSKSIAPPLWLKVKRAGNAWMESWSTDGVNYTVGGTFQFTLNANSVGLFAANYGNPASAAPAMTAAVDYFYNTANVSAAPDMTITKSHSGNFTQGGTGMYTITTKNGGTGSTSGTVTVNDTLPTGLTATAFNGTDWTCALTPSINCTRSDILAAGSSYPALTLTVSVASNAPGSVTNTATVAGGGETNTSNDTAGDPTIIQPPGQPPMISNIAAAVTSSSATITWTTDVSSTSRVDYGTTAGYGLTVSNASLVTNHSLGITGLNCATIYQYSVTSSDAAGRSASSSNQALTTASCTTASGPVSDNFDALALNSSVWTFVNPVGDGVLTFNGSEAQITVPHGSGHDVGTGGNRSARIMQSVSNTDFQVEIRFNSVLMFPSQMQGIIVEQDAGNYIRFDSYHDGNSPRLFCATFVSGNPTVRVDTPIVTSSHGPPFWLRVSRSGSTWTQSYSTDGANYTVGVTFTHSMNVARIGPFAGNAPSGSDAPAFTASVDYFFNSASPVPNNDGPLLFDRFVIDPNPPTTTLEKVLTDVDGDGRLDAVIGFGNPPGASQGQGIAWYQFPHSGNPADPWNRFPILSSGNMYEDMAAYDVNQDGAIDVIASFDGGQIFWFENPRGHGGNPGTDPWVQHFIGNGTGENNMVMADIDGDGKLDLVTNGFIFFQNGPVSWTPVNYNRTSNGAALMDIGSGKGPINLIGMANFSPFPFVWLENPREHGGNARTDAWIAHVIGPGYDTTGNTPAAFGTADLNGDGRMDLVTGFAEGPNPPETIGTLYWWEAPADRRNGAWTRHVIDSSYTSSHNMKLADVDGNGAIDIVISEQEQTPQRRVSIFYNGGQGTFSQKILSNGSGHNVTLGDADADGDLDILNAGHGFFGAPHPVELYRNRKNGQ